MRKITDHQLNELNRLLDLTAVDEAQEGGQSNAYEIRLNVPAGSRLANMLRLDFQNGPVGSAADLNGISMEVLLAILIDRLKGFQGMNSSVTGKAAPHACRENAIALTHLEDALNWLRKRTLDRQARGVENTRKP